MQTKKLDLQDILPLTCSRSGACCHGNKVHLNPWELQYLAKEKKISASEFRELFCESGGILLRFNGKADFSDKKACSQYIEDVGCGVYLGRPLACRLFPLGRQIQSETVQFIYQGEEFPCLSSCPEVLTLPKISVGEYLQGQQTELFEKAQDGYLDLMQNIADLAFALLLDTGLAESGDQKTLQGWRKMGLIPPEIIAQEIGNEWLELLMLPTINLDLEDPTSFINAHNELLQLNAQAKFGTLQSNQELQEASILLLGVALYLGCSIGANLQSLSEHWIEIAKKHGAME
jgi:uncharacterized protein